VDIILLSAKVSYASGLCRVDIIVMFGLGNYGSHSDSHYSYNHYLDKHYLDNLYSDNYYLDNYYSDNYHSDNHHSHLTQHIHSTKESISYLHK
jgi:hypothetical protein